MSGSLNKVQLIGNLGRDPEIRSMSSGSRVANFSIATTESWKDKSTGEKKEQTEWHNICVFGKLVDVIEKYVKKGSKVYISGSLKTRKWTDEASGEDKYKTEIVLNGFGSEFIMLDSRGDQQQQQSSDATPQAQAPADNLPDDDEIPF